METSGRSSTTNSNAQASSDKSDKAVNAFLVQVPEYPNHSNATPGDLVQTWRDNTAFQASKLSEIYMGTWMAISGSVYNVKNAFAPGEMRVTVDSLPGVTMVICTFPKGWEQHCAVLRKGDRVNILGKGSEIDSHTVPLEECEFVKAD